MQDHWKDLGYTKILNKNEKRHQKEYWYNGRDWSMHSFEVNIEKTEKCQEYNYLKPSSLGGFRRQSISEEPNRPNNLFLAGHEPSGAEKPFGRRLCNFNSGLRSHTPTFHSVETDQDVTSTTENLLNERVSANEMRNDTNDSDSTLSKDECVIVGTMSQAKKADVKCAFHENYALNPDSETNTLENCTYDENCVQAHSVRTYDSKTAPKAMYNDTISYSDTPNYENEGKSSRNSNNANILKPQSDKNVPVSLSGLESDITQKDDTRLKHLKLRDSFRKNIDCSVKIDAIKKQIENKVKSNDFFTDKYNIKISSNANLDDSGFFSETGTIKTQKSPIKNFKGHVKKKVKMFEKGKLVPVGDVDNQREGRNGSVKKSEKYLSKHVSDTSDYPILGIDDSYKIIPLKDKANYAVNKSTVSKLGKINSSNYKLHKESSTSDRTPECCYLSCQNRSTLSDKSETTEFQSLEEHNMSNKFPENPESRRIYSKLNNLKQYLRNKSSLDNKESGSSLVETRDLPVMNFESDLENDLIVKIACASDVDGKANGKENQFSAFNMDTFAMLNMYRQTDLYDDNVENLKDVKNQSNSITNEIGQEEKKHYYKVAEERDKVNAGQNNDSAASYDTGESINILRKISNNGHSNSLDGSPYYGKTNHVKSTFQRLNLPDISMSTSSRENANIFENCGVNSGELSKNNPVFFPREMKFSSSRRKMSNDEHSSSSSGNLCYDKTYNIKSIFQRFTLPNVSIRTSNREHSNILENSKDNSGECLRKSPADSLKDIKFTSLRKQLPSHFAEVFPEINEEPMQSNKKEKKFLSGGNEDCYDQDDIKRRTCYKVLKQIFPMQDVKQSEATMKAYDKMFSELKEEMVAKFEKKRRQISDEGIVDLSTERQPNGLSKERHLARAFRLISPESKNVGTSKAMFLKKLKKNRLKKSHENDLKLPRAIPKRGVSKSSYCNEDSCFGPRNKRIKNSDSSRSNSKSPDKEKHIVQRCKDSENGSSGDEISNKANLSPLHGDKVACPIDSLKSNSSSLNTACKTLKYGKTNYAKSRRFKMLRVISFQEAQNNASKKLRMLRKSIAESTADVSGTTSDVRLHPIESGINEDEAATNFNIPLSGISNEGEAKSHEQGSSVDVRAFVQAIEQRIDLRQPQIAFQFCRTPKTAEYSCSAFENLPVQSEIETKLGPHMTSEIQTEERNVSLYEHRKRSNIFVNLISVRQFVAICLFVFVLNCFFFHFIKLQDMY